MEKKVTLGYTQGRSDKIYKIELFKVDDGWKVVVEYGKRHNVNHIDDKTPKPLSYADAAELFDELFQAKRKKGYVIEEQWSQQLSS